MAFSKKCSAWGLGAALMLAAAGPAMGADTGGDAAGGTPSFVPPNWIFVGFDLFVLSLLALASIAGIALAIDAILNIREKKIAPARTTAHLRSLIEGRQYQDLLDFTATDKTFVSRALYAAIKRAHLKYAVMHEALEASIGEQTANLFRRIEPLNVIGNIGPLLGLLGTVLGMIMAFYELMRQGGNTPTASKLAGGIGTALWHTFFGLLVAIPCLVIYGFYRTKVDRITNRAANEAEELLESLRPSPGEGDEILRRRKPSRESAGAEREAVAEAQGAEE
ncbi:MAG TPA: MotA/TolQ/ExbB proton channel family protein [Phycisphaerae bacterium]|nr:MotA/TolQ/ExbB proton channel family protein [Phycisphaerae bacterium]